MTERAGGREWFSDRLFVDAEDGHMREGYGLSIVAHLMCAIVVIVVLLTRPVQTVLVRAGSSLVMPTLISMVSVVDPPSLTRPRSTERSTPTPTLKPTPLPAAAAPSPAAGVMPPAPVEAPSGITPETGAEGGGGGVDGGIAGGVIHGVADGAWSGATGPLRPGGGIAPLRKIKHVKPVYPQGGLSGEVRGTVVIDATIGTDGKVEAAKVLHSVPPLDQAALDAVRQWEYVPSLLNGVPVAVILTVIVNFAIQ